MTTKRTIRTIGDLLRVENPDKLNPIQRNIYNQVKREIPYIEKQLAKYDQSKPIPKTCGEVWNTTNVCQLGVTHYKLWKERQDEKEFFNMLGEIEKHPNDIDVNDWFPEMDFDDSIFDLGSKKEK